MAKGLHEHKIMVPIEKKPNATECADFRTISLICHASKIMLRILTKRLTSKVESQHYLGDDQFGFRKQKGTRDAIAAMRLMSERSLQHDQEMFVCFVEY